MPSRPTPESVRPVLRVAVVACRYGTEVVGGVETSLRTIAETLHEGGHRVEVFATCAVAENAAGGAGGPDSTSVEGIVVRRFPADRRDPALFARAQQHLAHDRDPAAAEAEYLAHSIRAADLVSNLRTRIDEFDAVIVGPYLQGLTHDVARAFPDKALVAPCFHDEPAARLPKLLEAYRDAGGVLYHSPEEQVFAETELGVNHPRAACVGTWVETAATGDAAKGAQHVGIGRRYILYAGRCAAQKNVPLLFDWAGRYAAAHPERFTFAFVGDDRQAIPDAEWAVGLGNVDDVTRRDLMAGAAALVQMSRMESLSLVVLEAWVQGVPAIVHRDCAVLAGQLGRSDGGRAVNDYASFQAALDDLWENPARWESLGRQGQVYVRRQYADRSAFRASLEDAVRRLHLPLGEAMRERGLRLASRYDRAVWQEQFGRIVADVLHAPPRAVRVQVNVRPRVEQRAVPAGMGSTVVPVTIANRGTHAVAAAGLARWVVRSEVRTALGEPVGPAVDDTPLPGSLAPGQAALAVARVEVPAQPGEYDVFFRVEPALQQDGPAARQAFHPLPECALRLTVEASTSGAAPPALASFLPAAQAALAQAEKLRQLPDDYTDVTQGWLARYKRYIKSKLLHNFRRAYVDVLSRQQSAFNRQVLHALQELAECCAALAQTHQPQSEVPKDMNTMDGNGHDRAAGAAPGSEQELLDQLAENRRQVAALERRLARIEALLLAREMVIT